MGTDAIPGAKRSSSQFRTDSKQPALPSRGSQSALARSISGEQSKASPGAAALGTTCISGAPAVPDLFASHHLPRSPPGGKRGLIHISSLHPRFPESGVSFILVHYIPTLTAQAGSSRKRRQEQTKLEDLSAFSVQARPTFSGFTSRHNTVPGLSLSY